jgi:hypothetical protein
MTFESVNIICNWRRVWCSRGWLGGGGEAEPPLEATGGHVSIARDGYFSNVSTYLYPL